LPDYGAAQPRIPTALDLDERRDPILVDEEVVEGPIGSAVLLSRHPRLARDQQPTSWNIRIDVISGNQVRVASQEVLKVVLARIMRLLELNQPTIIADEEDATDHGASFSGSVRRSASTTGAAPSDVSTPT
jgi:hypothetical protein